MARVKALADVETAQRQARAGAFPAHVVTPHAVAQVALRLGLQQLEDANELRGELQRQKDARERGDGEPAEEPVP